MPNRASHSLPTRRELDRASDLPCKGSAGRGALPATRRDARKSSSARGYGTRWAKYRLGFLRRNPLCVKCRAAGLTTPATVVDHITPHRGDQALFWEPTNHQALCSTCHSGDKQRHEKSGRARYRGCSPDGSPLDPKHPWNDAA